MSRKIQCRERVSRQALSLSLRRRYRRSRLGRNPECTRYFRGNSEPYNTSRYRIALPESSAPDALRVIRPNQRNNGNACRSRFFNRIRRRLHVTDFQHAAGRCLRCGGKFRRLPARIFRRRRFPHRRPHRSPKRFRLFFLTSKSGIPFTVQSCRNISFNRR